MNSNKYLEQSGRTMAPLETTYGNLNSSHKLNLLHAILGISGEAGELVDAIKKGIFYRENSTIDTINIEEELGDVLWYVALALRTIGSDFETCMEKNINKLKLRYPDKFSEKSYNNRDLEAERQSLEKQQPLDINDHKSFENREPFSKGSEGFTPMIGGKEIETN